jgi:hypothetical protein
MSWLRRSVIAVLGALLVIEAFVAQHFPVVQFVVGIIMLGLIPIDVIVDSLSRPSHDEGEIDRLREVMRKERDDDGAA